MVSQKASVRQTERVSESLSEGPERSKRGSPLLGQGGVDATSNRCREASFEGADGVVGSTTDYSVV
jgi:hypothetical protein